MRETENEKVLGYLDGIDHHCGKNESIGFRCDLPRYDRHRRTGCLDLMLWGAALLAVPFGQKWSFLSGSHTLPGINRLAWTKTFGKTFVVLAGFCHIET